MMESSLWSLSSRSPCHVVARRNPDEIRVRRPVPEEGEATLEVPGLSKKAKKKAKLMLQARGMHVPDDDDGDNHHHEHGEAVRGLHSHL
jgi:hypothetical protein